MMCIILNRSRCIIIKIESSRGCFSGILFSYIREVMKGMGPPLDFPYYYGREAEQYAFYRIPKLLISDDRFRFVSTDAKLLYGLMLDRMSLSLKNGWLDSDNRVYIYFPVEEAMEVLNCKSEKATKLLAELDGKKGIGLIERVRQGQGKPSIVYVKNFAAPRRRQLSKVLTFDNRKSEFSGRLRHFQTFGNRKSRLRKIEM